MELQDYCNGLQFELTGWKAKVYDVVRRFDKMSSGDKTKAVPHINELHAIIEELTGRIERLNKECPTDWEHEKVAVEGKVSELNTRWEELLDTNAPTHRQQFAYVTDRAGNEYLCPVDALSQAEKFSEEDLRNCIDDASVHQAGPGG
jgi:predicted nuclease with TOPRIM domain